MITMSWINSINMSFADKFIKCMKFGKSYTILSEGRIDELFKKYQLMHSLYYPIILQKR
jgi:hypothetical protein